MTNVIKLGMFCELGTRCGCIDKMYKNDLLVCPAEHLFVDYVEKDRLTYAQILYVMESRKGFYMNVEIKE